MKDLFVHYPQLICCTDAIDKAVDLMEQTYRAGGKILLCGNGGSAADCEHISGELLKSFRRVRPIPQDDRDRLTALLGAGEASLFADTLQCGIPCIPLTSLSSASTAFINDVTPDMVYAQLVYALGTKNDLLIALTTSGNSRNVVNALKTARAFGIQSVAMTGIAPESDASRYADVTIAAPETETYLVQELHLPIYHYLCAELERRVF